MRKLKGFDLLVKHNNWYRVFNATRAATQPAPDFDPSDLFGEGDFGDWWDFRTNDGLFIADDGETDPVGENDPVGSAVGRRGVITLKQPTTGDKPLWAGNEIQSTSSSQFLEAIFDLRGPENHSLFMVSRTVSGTSTFTNGASILTREGGSIRLMLRQRIENLSVVRYGSSTIVSSVNKGTDNQYASISDLEDDGGPVAVRSISTQGPDGGDYSYVLGSRAGYDRLLLSFGFGLGQPSAASCAFYIDRDITDGEVASLVNYFGEIL